ncbi:MAG: hypothetical protein QOG73_1167 [Acetobacteraceae bacterium]|jgi:hypothetical protein|nr:hypothetical protein [Acetobacteraceae bacterium]
MMVGADRPRCALRTMCRCADVHFLMSSLFNSGQMRNEDLAFMLRCTI